MRKAVFWENPRYRSTAALEGDIETRFLIVGGGITGVMCAWYLLQRGISPRDIVLLEARTIGDGSTGRSAGILVTEPENEQNVWWDVLEKKYGKKLIASYQRAHLDALHALKQLIVRGHIACDAEAHYMLILARDAAAAKVLVKDHEARRHAGINTEVLTGRSYASEFGGCGYIAAERDIEGLSVNPLALVQGIAIYLRRKGVRVFEHTPLVRALRGVAKTPRGSIDFEKVIYARGMAERLRGMDTFITTIAITHPLPRRTLRALRLDDRDMFCDAIGNQPFHYGKVTKHNRLLLGFGDIATDKNVSEAKTHMPHVREILRFLKRVFPTHAFTIDSAWSAGYAISRSLVPLVRIGTSTAVLNGSGIQLSSIVAADYAVAKLLGKKHALDNLWQKSV